ncbi:predicted protein [Nematostella vectensis]|uniref:Uncharacterized protein n=1 Tax=Nematostella vectensis TaxID=45351 RepID=A7SMC4_NEMVE|nr:predicted protein [Nematostella vectensis]|eukprot:XP_001627243.1 predicted protein [Nematostella vectensis]
MPKFGHVGPYSEQVKRDHDGKIVDIIPKGNPMEDAGVGLVLLVNSKTRITTVNLLTGPWGFAYHGFRSLSFDEKEADNQTSPSQSESKKLDTYWRKFEEYVSPKSNFRLARYKLRALKQQKEESVDSFLRKGKPNKGKFSKKIHTIDECGSQEPPASQLYYNSIAIDSIVKGETQAIVNLQIDSGQVTQQLPCKINTGAEGNIPPIGSYTQLHPHTPRDQDGRPQGLKPSNTKITAFGGHIIEQYGTCLLSLSHGDITNKCAFHVVDTEGPIILGLPTCSDMKLVTLNHVITAKPASAATAPASMDYSTDKSSLLSEHAKCFKGIGCF